MAKRLMALSAPLATLAEIEHAIWRELGTALHTRGHAWRQAVLATNDGSAADARTVILREVHAQARRLVIYSDARSPKLAQIAAQPLGTLLLWSAPLGWQLRLRVRLHADTDGPEVQTRWQRLQASPAARDYQAVLAPGSVLEGPPQAAGAKEAPSAATPAASAPSAPTVPDSPHFFALLSAEVLAADWLELHAEGHRRALFDATGQRWLAP